MTYRYLDRRKKPIWFIVLAIISLYQSVSMMSISIYQLDSSFWVGILYFILAIGALVVAYALYTPKKWGWWFSILTYGVIYLFEAIITYSTISDFDLEENEILSFWFESTMFNVITWAVISSYVHSNKPYFTGKIEVYGHNQLFEAERKYKEQRELEEKEKLEKLHGIVESDKIIVID